MVPKPLPIFSPTNDQTLMNIARKHQLSKLQSCRFDPSFLFLVFVCGAGGWANRVFWKRMFGGGDGGGGRVALDSIHLT